MERDNLTGPEALLEKKERRKDPTLSEAVEEFMERSRLDGHATRRGARKPNRRSTMEGKRVSMDYWMKHLGPNRRLSDITQDEVIRFREAMRIGKQIKKERGSASINLDLRTWLTFGGFCIKQGYPLDSKCLDFSFLPDPPKKRPPSKEEVKTILQELDADLSLNETQKDLLRLIISHGQRAWSQVANIETTWIDFEAKSYTVPASEDKGRQDVMIFLGDVAVQILKRRYHAAKTSGTVFLFPNPKTGRPYGVKCFRRFFMRLEKRTGIRCTTKSFRHFWQTEAQLINPLVAVKAQGHRTLSVPATAYAHHHGPEFLDLANKLEEKIFPPSVYQSRTPRNPDSLN